MRFLVDEDLPRAVGRIVLEFGHDIVDVRDHGLRGASDAVIAEYARAHGLCLLTGDFDFSDIRNYPPSRYFGIVVLSPGVAGATASHYGSLVSSLMGETSVLRDLPGKLAIVEPDRVRLRS